MYVNITTDATPDRTISLNELTTVDDPCVHTPELQNELVYDDGGGGDVYF